MAAISVTSVFVYRNFDHFFMLSELKTEDLYWTQWPSWLKLKRRKLAKRSGKIGLGRVGPSRPMTQNGNLKYTYVF